MKGKGLIAHRRSAPKRQVRPGQVYEHISYCFDLSYAMHILKHKSPRFDTGGFYQSIIRFLFVSNDGLIGLQDRIPAQGDFLTGIQIKGIAGEIDGAGSFARI